jgi:NTE family protein
MGLALMLSGGGARTAYQTGVLSGIGKRRPDLYTPLLTGVSAGGINLGFIAAHRGSFGEATQALKRRWLSLTTEEVFRTDPPSLLKTGARWGLSIAGGGARFTPRGRSLVDTAPLREFLRRSIDATGKESNLADGVHEAVALSYQTGRTVTFVQGDVPIRLEPPSVHQRAVRARLTIEHIMASSAIPLLFPAVKIGQQYYGDGSFRSAAPLGPAIQLGAERILAISARYARSEIEARRPEVLGYPPPARVLGVLLNSVFLDTLDWDASTVERINRLIDQIPEQRRREEGLRRVDLYVQRPSKDIGRLAASFEVRLPRSLRFLVRGLGSSGSKSADFISYLLFESAYISALIELGEEDVERDWDRLSAFLEPAASTPDAGI